MNLRTNLNVPLPDNQFLVIRKVSNADISAIFAILKKQSVLQWLSIDTPESEDDIKKQVKFAQMDWTANLGLSYSIFFMDTLIGAINLYNIRWHHARAEIGIWLDDAYWGKGYGTLVMKTIIRFAYHELDLNRIEAHIYPDNIASIKLFEKVGFKLEGFCEDYVKDMDGFFREVVQYALIKAKNKIEVNK